MAQSGEDSSKPLSLEDLIALNKEIASLVQAGVPLPLGLRAMAADSSRSLRAVTERLADRLERGETLTQALDGMRDAVPPVYAAVVASGLRAGRLPEALASLTRLAKSAQDIRRQLVIAAIAPLTVVIAAYVLFVAFLVLMVPGLQQTHVAMEIPQSWWIETLARLNGTVKYWGPIPPLVCLGVWLLSAVVGRSLDRGRTVGGGVFELGGFRWVPGMGTIARTWHWANFAELWGLLVSHNVVLPEAIFLAAHATGDRRIVRAADSLIDQLQSGRSLAECFAASPASFPPVFKWLSTNVEGQLSSVLQRISKLLCRRANYQADWLKVLVPVGLTVFVAGGVTLLYGLTLFYTMAGLYHDLAIP
ncbi:MAG: type II secretion system F family protein [Planctomycetaceae bacterium]